MAPIVTTPGNTTSCTYTAVGTVTSKVTVSSATATGRGSTTVTVAAAPLLVAITTSNPTPAAGGFVSFTATVTSVGPIPATLQWEWDDEGDGTFEILIPSAANPNVRITSYGSTGVRIIKVRVTDTVTGRVTTGARSVTVLP